MSIVNQIKESKSQAQARKDFAETALLSTILGEIDTQKNRKGWKDGNEVNVVKKMVKDNESILKLDITPEKRGKIKEEIKLLSEFLPQALNPEVVQSSLSSISQDIILAKSDGQRIGIAMKHFAKMNAFVEMSTIKTAIGKIMGKPLK